MGQWATFGDTVTWVSLKCASDGRNGIVVVSAVAQAHGTYPQHHS